MNLSPEYRAELLALAQSARAQLEAELELGLAGVPLLATAEPRTPQAQRAAASTPPRPTPAGVGPPRPPHERPVELSSGASPRRLPEAEPISPDTAAQAAPRHERLRLLAEEAASCTRCVLHEKRTRSVFSRGSPEAELVFVGEGPGRDEDLQGLPFVGAAGQLLDKMIAAMGYGREDVYICNVVKCRPPENRTPRPEEALACSRFLVPQLQAVAPKIIVALGRCAAQSLGVAGDTGAWRGRWGEFQGIVVMPTYHPAFLLRSPEQKRTVWEDLQQVMARLGRAVPARR
jgi:DNA polymerase